MHAQERLVAGAMLARTETLLMYVMRLENAGLVISSVPLRAVWRCGDDVAAGPPIELGIASRSAGEP